MLTNNSVSLEKRLLKIRKGMNPHYRFHASVNIGADNPEDIYILFSDNL